MILPYVYDSWANIHRVADRLEEAMNKYESLSINSAHEIVNELFWLQDVIKKPEWMEEPEFRYVDEKRGWYKKEFHVYIKRIRWHGGSGYILELPDPIHFV